MDFFFLFYFSRELIIESIKTAKDHVFTTKRCVYKFTTALTRRPPSSRHREMPRSRRRVGDGQPEILQDARSGTSGKLIVRFFSRSAVQKW